MNDQVSQVPQIKFCPKCGITKVLSEFSPITSRANRFGGVAAWCKKCCYSNAKVRIESRRKEVDKIKLAAGCSRCGYKEHPAALDFDHLPGTVKYMNVSMMFTCSRQKVMEEISKCQVLCSNCHKIITWERNRNGNNVHQ
jgi:hypothetical protein